MTDKRMPDVKGRLRYLHSNMKMLRQAKRLTQETIAEKLNMNRSAYSEYEQGHRIPDLQTIDALAAYYDIAMDVLVNYDLSNGLLNRIYLDESNREMARVMTRFKSLSAASQKMILERIETLLERENVFYSEYAEETSPHTGNARKGL